MLATIRDDTWDMLNTQHNPPNLKRWDDIYFLDGATWKVKGPTHMVEGDHQLRKRPNPHPWMMMERWCIMSTRAYSIDVMMCSIVSRHVLHSMSVSKPPVSPRSKSANWQTDVDTTISVTQPQEWSLIRWYLPWITTYKWGFEMHIRKGF